MWSEVRSQITASAEDVDAGGALILPSFTDAHVHPAQAGLELLDCDLSGARSQGEVLDLVRDYASKHPDQPWILGAGWQTVQFGRGGPRASQLDEIAPGRPIVLTDAGHHATWMSSTALRLLGITASTPDPVDGRIDRDANGQPSGVVHEGAMEIGREIIPVPSPDRIADGLLEAQRTLFSVGVTGWQDAIVGDYAGSLDSTAGYHTAYQRGTFQARTTAALWLDRSASERNPRDVAEELLARRRHFES
ncbi:MAG TPA: amidohydrolase family protein, partial [Terrimesophilobacter sp.]|nr:amidohydrolase family protein [Terrimesophilobacter sp.]